MHILLLGSGGREHAFAQKLVQSKQCTQLFIAPGSPGTAQLGININCSATDFNGIKKIVLENAIQLVVVGPEVPLVEGVFVGAVSLMYASLFDGIIFHAVSLTIGVLFLMLFLYKAKIIEVTQRLRSVIMMATGAIMLTYLVSFVLSFFNIQVPMIHSTGWLGIGFSLVVVVIASLNLLLDFDFFEKGEQAGLPKYMEWFAGMGLMITLVWLYLEILRLLSKISSRD